MITIEKKGDTFTQIVTLYYINISLSPHPQNQLIPTTRSKKKEKIQRKREENPTLQLEERNPSYCSQSPRFWSQRYLQAEGSSRRREEATRQKSTRASMNCRIFMAIQGTQVLDFGPQIHMISGSFCMVTDLGIWIQIFLRLAQNFWIQCIFQKLSSLASKK